MANQLQSITEQLASMRRFQTRAMAREDEDETLDAKASMYKKEEAWETVVDTLKEREKATTDSWKDELNNLLIFTGLFSAIVTAFTVVSLSWLQQDSGDATNILLAHISLQLSSFVISTGHVNSSVPSVPLVNVTSSFIPSGYAVPVNVLWVLSLTLSLIAAFFAITVQQWLRQLQLPLGIPLRKAAHMLSLRYDGLQAWQVPGIISLLPLLLQVAVILFLTGLFIVFRALNHTVTIVFGSVTSLGLLALLIMTVVPLISVRCPYKSPFIPTLAIVLQWISYPFALLPLGILYAVKLVCRSRTVYLWLIRHNLHDVYLDQVVMRYHSLYDYIWSFGRHMLVGNITQFWVLRECRHVAALDHYDSFNLDDSSLADVVLSTSSSSVPTILRCFEDINHEWADIIFANVVERSVAGIAPTDEDGLKIHVPTSAGLYEVWDVSKAPRIRQWFSIRHSRLGWHLLRHRDQLHSSRFPWPVLYLFNELSKIVIPIRPSFTRLLFRVFTRPEMHGNTPTSALYGLYPARLLLETLQEDAISISIRIDQQDLTTFAAASSALSRQFTSISPCDPDVLRLRLTWSASALVIMVANGSVFDAVGSDVIGSLISLLENSEVLDTLALSIQEYYTSRPDYALPFVIQAICEAMLKLTSCRTDAITRDPITPLYARLIASLRAVCEKLQEEDQVEVTKHLDWLDEVVASRAISLSGSVHAEVAVSEADETA
ncbi:hypothetical protein NM688_g305 [Phlebia brevispora]|uniref:Uncharacterized protein n=1 Tax=Phlebia brevispora TaxID=194682 RepID=A0ACC1TFG8_9APHY|nr:hypothetical protein NM688_g305 [Phlebia brevispora]